MKKLLIPILLIIAVTSAYGAPFSPTKMVLTAATAVNYNFDGSVLHIPLNIQGVSANTIFMVYTKDKGNDIGTFQNGLLGWHYVNKVDTCVYLRADGLHATGASEIVWDGKDTHGALVPAGTYTYYLWGYDNQNPKIPAMRAVSMGNMTAQFNHVEDKDVDGNALANPIVYFCTKTNSRNSQKAPMEEYKWSIGTDPATALTDLEKTTTGQTGNINRHGSDITLDTKDHSMLFVGEVGPDYSIYVTKYKWVPGSAATLQTDWGENGTYLWKTELPGYMPLTGVVSDGADLLFMSYMNQTNPAPFSQILYLNREDGSKIKTIEMSQWYCDKASLDVGGQMNGGPTDFGFANGILTSQGHYWCTTLAIDPYRETGDEIIWTNRNGDYIHDKNFAPDAKLKWACNDFGPPPWTYTWHTDSMGFSVFPVNNVGTGAFGLIGPTGQGVGYLGIGTGLGLTGCVYPMKVGSAYDGLFVPNAEPGGVAPQVDLAGAWWLAYDTVKGTITVEVVGVEDASPAAFSVAQNTPNPFNPSTTISFTLAKAGKVTVDIFNISGQKVDTLVNTTMNAGAHSVTWNASKHSAGLYFYTVKSENSSKTMKMTLLK